MASQVAPLLVLCLLLLAMAVTVTAQDDHCWLPLCELTWPPFTGDHGDLPLAGADHPILIPPGAGLGAAGARSRGAEEGCRGAAAGALGGRLTPDLMSSFLTHPMA